MEIRVKIEKRHAFLIAGAIALFALSIFAYAFTGGTGGIPSVMGHSPDEIDWSKTIVSDVNISGNISGAGFCLGGSCKTNWSQVGGVSPYFDRQGREGTNLGYIGVGSYTCPAGTAMTSFHQNYAAGSVQTYYIDSVTCSPVPFSYN